MGDIDFGLEEIGGKEVDNCEVEGKELVCDMVDGSEERVDISMVDDDIRKKFD